MDINWQELYKEYREENTKTFPLYEGFLKSPKEVFDWFKNRLSEKTVDDVIEWLDETEQPTPAPISERDLESQINKHLNTLPYAGGFPYDWKETLAKSLYSWLTQNNLREGVESAKGLLNEILHDDSQRGLLQDTVITRKHNGLEYDMVRKDLAVIAMKEFASQFTASTGTGSVNTLLAEVLSKYIKYIRDVDGTDYILVHDERYASDVKFTDEQWQLLTDVAKK